MGASESKLAFKEGAFKIVGTPNISIDDAYWRGWYEVPETSDDVFTLWSPADLRSLTEHDTNRTGLATAVAASSPVAANVETLLYAMMSRLMSLRNHPSFPNLDTAPAQQALNCIRVLTRVLPYIYECDHLANWEDQFFWQERHPRSMWDTKEDKQGELFDGLNPKKKYSAGSEDENIGRPLGEELIDTLIDLLFLPGFTLPFGGDEKQGRAVKYTIWASGIGSKSSPGMTKENENNATETLRLLLTMTSKTMYMPPNLIATTGVRALTYITTANGRQIVLSMLCSLLNTILKYNPASWRVPFESLALKDPKQLLVTYCLQFLLVLVVYPVPGNGQNAFRKSLGRLHLAQDFQFIQNGLTMVLTQPVSGVASYMPTNNKALPWAPEMLVLFWELLQCNKRFRSFIIDTDRAHDFVVLVLYYAMEAKDDPNKQGIVRMCVFILQTLSVESAFGSRLNKPFQGQETLPALMRIQNFHGTYADYLITTIHTMLTTTKGRLETIYPALLAIVNNIAPFVQNLGRATSSKLLDLFSTMSSPSFLLANESNHGLLESLLEALNTIIEHQYAANRRFIEIVVRHRARFEALRDFTLEGAQEELHRQAQMRKDLASGGDGVRSPVRAASLDSLRSPVSARTPSLGNVPEDSAFAIGDEETSDDESEMQPTPSRSSVQSSRAASISSPTDVAQAVPIQLGGMSEKARGKMAAGQGSFSRQQSRNASTTSLASISNAISNQETSVSSAGGFIATSAWLDQWLPLLPLNTILTVLSHHDGRSEHEHHDVQAGDARSADADTAAVPRPASKHPSLESGPLKVHTFTWTSLALVWYQSMLWGFIYSGDVAMNRGSSSGFGGTVVKLFNVQSARDDGPSLRSPKGAVDAVGNRLVRVFQ